jgi:phospholipase/carboxylesterase
MPAIARATAAAFLLLVQPGCARAAAPEERAVGADPKAGELAARPAAVTATGKTGLSTIDNPGGRSGLLYVPASYRSEKPAPLVVMLHGAGGTAQHSIDLARRHADRLGFIVYAPTSAAATWDIISGRSYGPDVATIDRALGAVFAGYAIDPKRVAVAGFSDGASYALSLGLTNGGLFTDIIAFSPGFMAPGEAKGRPEIFISHGIADRVLPIDVCSRRIVPLLKRAGYGVDYREFAGGHSVPPDLARAAFDRFGGG